jgi:hypothetical protein
VAVQAFVTSQCAQTGYLKKAVAEGDIDAARRARAAMWETLYPTFQALYAMGANWNALAAALETTPGSG